ncbi:helix-turn-helix domain-containing protein [Brevundimonas sp.]|uniref:helix-turn-helix domain-containing protein n=1 Tax=Brevundimonas sp. TaxID=1871086 RepID=UPI003566CB53
MSNEPSGPILFLEAFAEHIRRWRTALEISQAAVARHSCLSVSTIRRIEAGKVDMKVTTFLALTKAMDAELYELVDVGWDEFAVKSDAYFKATKH